MNAQIRASALSEVLNRRCLRYVTNRDVLNAVSEAFVVVHRAAAGHSITLSGLRRKAVRFGLSIECENAASGAAEGRRDE